MLNQKALNTVAPFIAYNNRSFRMKKLSWDRFGNKYTAAEMNMDSVKLYHNTSECDQGYFHILFVGIADENQKSCICQVFHDLSEIILRRENTTCGAPIMNQKVNIQIDYNIFNTTHAGEGTPFIDFSFIQPQSISCSNVTYQVKDIPIFTKINRGYYWLYSNSLPDLTHLDAAIHINPNLDFYTDFVTNPPTPGPLQYDLYSITLHEALHCLGFLSLIGTDGKPIAAYLGGNLTDLTVYNRFDQFIYFTDDYDGNPPAASEQLIKSAPDINCWGFNTDAFTGNLSGTPNDFTDAVVNACTTDNSAPDFEFYDDLVTAPIKGFTQGNTITNDAEMSNMLSHLSEGCNGQTAEYVMRPTISYQETRRHLNLNEKKILCRLGYKVDLGDGEGICDKCYIAATDESGPFSTIYPYLTCCKKDYHICVNESITIQASDLLCNDNSNEPISITYLVLSGSGTIIDNQDQTWTFTSSSIGTKNIYYSIKSCDDIKATGILSVLVSPCIPYCTINSECDNLACYGDAQNFTSLNTTYYEQLSADFYIYDGNYQNTPDICINQNNKFYRIGCFQPTNIEGILFHLAQPINPGCTVQLSFKASCSVQNSRLLAQFSHNRPCNPSEALIPMQCEGVSIDCGGFSYQPICIFNEVVPVGADNLVCPDNIDYTNYSLSWTNQSDEDIQYLIFTPFPESNSLASIFLDDISVNKPCLDPSFYFAIDCSEVSFTNNSIPELSHQWDFGDGSTSTDPNPVHGYIFQGTYTVTHTVTSSCGSATSTQTIVFDCVSYTCSCPPDANSYLIGEPGNQNDIHIGDSDLPPNSVSDACISIYGNLVIDVPGYSFIHCMIHMQPGSSITVLTSLGIANGTILEGCDKMWKGVVMGPNAALKMKESAIYDAEYALTTADHCHIYMSKNQFIRNYVGLYNPITSKQFDIYMIGNEFHCLNETLLPSYDLLDPPASQHTYAGVLIDVLEETSFGVMGMASNVFHDINNGFVSKKAGYGVYNCRFYNILNTTEYPVSGFGIHDEGDGKLTLVVEGTGITPLFPSFENCTDGIFVEKSSVDIRDNRMVKVLRGVDIHFGDDHKIDISDNQIECDQFGINLYQCSGAMDVQIVNNYICIDSFSYENPNKGNGIYLNDAMIPHPSALISGNYVNLWQRNSGINLRSSKNVIVDDNIIHMNNPNVNLMGIRIQGSTDCNIFCNHVESNESTTGNIGLSVSMTTNTIYENNTFFRNRFGANFSGSCLGTSLITNTFDQNKIGLHIASSGLIGPQPANTNDLLNGNIWINTTGQSRATWEDYVELIVFDNIILYNSNTPNTIPDLPSPDYWFGLSPNPTESPDPNYCAPYEMLEEDISSQDLVIAGDESSSSDIEETMDFIARRYLFRKLDENPELIFSNSLLETFWEEASDGTIGKLYNIGKDKATLYALETSLRQQIKDNEVAIKNYLSSIQAVNAGISDNPGSEEIANANSQKEAIFQQLEEIITDQKILFDQIKDERDPASEGVSINNEVITTSEVYETNEKNVNQIYLETIAKGNTDFTPEQLAQLEYIASQCPLTGGTAVYLARSLISIFFDDNYDDDSLCSDPISLMVLNNSRNTTNAVANHERIEPSKDEFTVFAMFYPNPAREQVTCRYYTKKGLTLTITDIVGNLIGKKGLKSTSTTFDIPVADFPAGNYLFTVQDSQGKIIHRENIVVIH